MSRLGAASPPQRGQLKHAQPAGTALKAHAVRLRSYLHEELGPGGGVLHHVVHHSDECLALTHLQQRKERMIHSHTWATRSPQAACLRYFPGTVKSSNSWDLQILRLVSPALSHHFVNPVPGTA